MRTIQKFHATLLLVLTLGAAVAQTNAPPAVPAKHKIGIMKFEVDPDLKPALSTFLYESFSGEMVASGAFTVVDWEQLDKVQKVVAQAQPNVSPEEARKMALHQLGIEKLYLGTLTKVGSKFYLTVKLLNLDLKVERSERLPAASEDDLEPTVVKLAKLLAASPEHAKAIKAQLGHQKAEADRWVEVEKNQTKESLAAFLEEFPDGALAAKAKKTLEESHNKRLADEADRKVKGAEQQVKRQEAERLRSNIDGRWKLVTTDAKIADGRAFNLVPGPSVCEIEQKDGSIAFKGPIVKKNALTTTLYKGTYESGVLRAKAKVSALVSATVDITGTISEDGWSIVGKWNYAFNGLTGSAVFTRMDAEAKP